MPYSINNLPPGYLTEYNRWANEYSSSHGGKPPPVSFEQWFVDGMYKSGEVNTTTDPNVLGVYEQLTGQSTGRLPGLLSSQSSASAATTLAQHADLQAAYNAAKATNPALDVTDFLIQYGDAHPTDTRFNDPSFLASVGLESNDLPIEQQLGNYVTQVGQADILKDADRQNYADNLISSYQPALSGVRQTIADLFPTAAVAPVFDPQQYLATNGDVASAFENNKSADGTVVLADGRHLNKEQFAQWHYDTYGKNEGRAQPMTAGAPAQASKMYRDSVAASEQARDAQLAALSEQLATMRGNLSGELAAKAGALQTQLSTLTSGLDTLTAAQKASLATQISANIASLETDVANRKASLATALDTMKTAVGTEADARRAALQTELEGLNAAQAPLNAAREKGAQSLVTAVNLGLETTKDKIAAQAAADGFVGSSTGTDAALARAAIAARQQGAVAVNDARTQNAADTAKIASYGATKGAGIAENAAAANTGIANYGATEGRAVADYGSGARRTIDDFMASQGRNISDQDAQGRYNISAYGAGEQRNLTNYGAEQTRAIGDLGATDTRGIKDAAASRTLGYFDTDLQRRLAALSLPSSALSSELSLRKSADDYGQSGLQRTMGNLSFFASGSSPAPQVQPYLVQPTQSGLENVGAGLLSAAGSIANANNWWQPSKTANISNVKMGTAPGTGFTTPGGNVGVQTDWSFT